MEPLLKTSSRGLGQARVVGGQRERVHKVVHAFEDLHACLEPVALAADLLEREERSESGCRRVGDDLGDTDLVRGPLARLVAGNRHEANDLASVDKRHEKAGREMLVVARPVRDLVITRVVDGDGALLANGAPARRVFGKGWIGVELLDQGVRSDGESIGEVGL